MSEPIQSKDIGNITGADSSGDVIYVKRKLVFGIDGDATDVSSVNPLPVSGSFAPPVGGATEAKQDVMIANLQAINSLIPTTYDYISLGYTAGNLSTVTFKTGGSGGATVSTLTLTYTADVLQSVTRT